MNNSAIYCVTEKRDYDYFLLGKRGIQTLLYGMVIIVSARPSIPKHIPNTLV